MRGERESVSPKIVEAEITAKRRKYVSGERRLLLWESANFPEWDPNAFTAPRAHFTLWCLIGSEHLAAALTITETFIKNSINYLPRLRPNTFTLMLPVCENGHFQMFDSLWDMVAGRFLKMCFVKIFWRGVRMNMCVGGAMKADGPGRSPSQQQGEGIISEITVFFSNIFPFFSTYLRIWFFQITNADNWPNADNWHKRNMLIMIR